MDRCPQCKRLLPHPGNCDRPASVTLPPLDPEHPDFKRDQAKEEEAK